MGAPKGSHNARSWNKKRMSSIKEQIGGALESTNRAGIAFQNVSALASYISPIVGQTAGNLTRNKEYRILLQNFLVRQKGAVTLLDESQRDINTLVARNRGLQLENANLLAENARLKKHIEMHMDRESFATAATSVVHDKPGQSDDSKKAFENTAHLLLSVLERAEGFEIDFKNGVITDMAAKPRERVIAGKAKTKWFIDFLKDQEGCNAL